MLPNPHLAPLHIPKAPQVLAGRPPRPNKKCVSGLCSPHSEALSFFSHADARQELTGGMRAVSQGKRAGTFGLIPTAPLPQPFWRQRLEVELIINGQ